MSQSSIQTEIGPVSRFITDRIHQLLRDHRLVVIYDGDQLYGSLLPVISEHLEGIDGIVISAAESELEARRQADQAYTTMGKQDGVGSMLIYVPRSRAVLREQWREDLFAAYAVVGRAFGVSESEQLKALALEAMPAQASAIERQFDAGSPTLETLDALGSGSAEGLPLLRQALGSSDPVIVLARAIVEEDLADKLAAVPGAKQELSQLVQTSLGITESLDPASAQFCDALLAYVLLTDLDQQLEGGLPEALKNAPHATGATAELTKRVLAHLLDMESGRGTLMAGAESIQDAYHIEQHLASDGPVPARDTFPIQDDIRFRAAIAAATSDDLDTAHQLAAGGASSLWRNDPERTQRWRAFERMVEFLRLSGDLQSQIPSSGGEPEALVKRYSEHGGPWQIDRGQRRFEQAFIEAAFDEELEPLLQHCRQRYAGVLGSMQEGFQTAVKKVGWPPEGLLRQTQIFDRKVEPALEVGRVAYFQIDSLRFEMGRDLASTLDEVGSVQLEPVAATLPTSTPVGMAALLPGADGALRLVETGGTLSPAIGDTLLRTLAERRAYLEQRFGDQIQEAQLSEVVSWPPTRLKKNFGAAKLLVVRSLDIDDSGEARDLTYAREVMSRAIGDIKRAVERLVSLGFQTFVLTGDHGHILLPEVAPGDVIDEPDGEWSVKKRRVAIGRRHGSASGSLVMTAEHLGVQTQPDDLEFAFPTGTRVYRSGEGYFHEGLSLQECVIPVVTVRADVPEENLTGSEQVRLEYRSDRFTSSVVGLRVTLASMLSPTLRVRVEAYTGSAPNAKRVGDAADCDARDPVTGEVNLTAGETVSVPVLIDPEFNGNEVEIRAIDPTTNVIHQRLKLKNARLD